MDGRFSTGLCFLGATLSGILFWLAFFPANQGWVGWFALAPWLATMTGQSTRQRLLSSLVFGLCFFTLALNWMRVADVRMIATWVMLTCWCTLFSLWCGTWAGLIVDRFPRLGWTFAFPVVAIPIEWLRSLALEGFPWYFLGHTQHEWNTLTQICDIFGVYGLSFFVGMVNGLCADLLTHCAGFSRWGFVFPGKALVAFGTLGVCLLYGNGRIAPVEFQPNTTIGVLQANHPQGVRNDGPAGEIMNDYLAMSQAVLRSARPLLLIWPETSYPHLLDLTGIDSTWSPDKTFPDRPSQLLGASVELMGPGKTVSLFNSSVLFDPSGSVPIARYDKIHRVPFGEYVPFKDWIPFMNVLAPYDHDYSIKSGDQLTRFPLPYGPEGFTFGAAICYESGDAPLFRNLAGGDGLKPVDFFVNQSNDGWFHGTEEHEQHFLLLRFRAIETRRPVIRSVNMGISGWIDPYGRVLEPRLVSGTQPEVYQVGDQFLSSSRWHEFKKKHFALFGPIPKAGPSSLYVIWGDRLPQVLLLLALGLVLVGPIPRANPK